MPRPEQSRPHRSPAGTLGEFAIERRLGGQPGVWTLYAARDLQGGGAVDVLLLRFLAERAAPQRALLEAVTLRERLQHPGLVGVVAVGRVPEGAWIATRNADARSLAQLIDAEGPLSPARALALLEPVAAALDAGHAEGLVCDSLTADAVLVSGRPGVDEHGQLTDLGPPWPADVRPGRLLGDPSCLSPEEIRGAPPTPASNVYALGAILVCCLTGAPPFGSPARAGVLSAHLSAPPPRLSERLAELPTALDDLVADALAKEPRERPGSAAQLVARAAAALADAPAARARPALAARPGAAPGDVAGPADRHPGQAAAGAQAPTDDAVPEAPLAPRAAVRPSDARRPPNATAMRALRRVAVLVPALALTALAVIAALHSGPSKSRPSAKRPAHARTVKTPVATAPLTAPTNPDDENAPTGTITIGASGNRHQLTVSGTHLRPEGEHPRQAYAVWLFNSPRDAALLGFVVPRVGKSGRFVSHRDLPTDAARYREIIVTLEDGLTAHPQGPVVLRGALPSAALKGSRPSPSDP